MAYNPVNPGDALSSSVVDINDAFDGLARWFASATAPASPFAYQRWLDTGTNILYVRDSTNAAWVPHALFSSETGVVVSDGTDSITVCAPAGLTGDYTIKLPTAQGSSSTFLRNDGTGVLTWVAGGASGATILDELGDVNITAAASGNYIRRNGTEFVNVAGVDVSDLTVGSETRGDLIVRGASGWVRLGLGTSGYVLGSNGTDVAWQAAGGGGSLDGLSDTTITAAASGDYLRHNGTAWVDVAGVDVSHLTVASEAQGDIILRGASSWARLPIGANGAFLKSNGTTASWVAASLAALSDTAIVAGQAGDYLRHNGTAWVDATGLIMTDLFVSAEAQGDIAYYNGSTWTRFAKGTTGHVLKSTATTIEWAAEAGGGGTLDGLSDTTITAAASGDYLRHNGTAWVDVAGVDVSHLTVASEARGDVVIRGVSSWQRLAVGTNGQYLQSDGTDVAWATPPGGAEVLTDLTDVTITTPAAGQAVRYSGSGWVNATIGVEDLGVGATSQGALIRRGATAWESLAKGSSGSVLEFDGTDAAWVGSTGTGSNVRSVAPTMTGSAQMQNLVVTGGFTVQSVNLDAVLGSQTVSLLCGATTASYNVNFPNSTTLPSSGTYYVKIAPNGNLSYTAS